MLRALKKVRFGQIALLAAGFLAVSGSFGLHPEPDPSAGPTTPRVGWTTADSSGQSAPHACLACLAHRSLSLPGLAAVVLAPGSSVIAAAVAAPSLLARLDPTPHEGRAPPALP